MNTREVYLTLDPQPPSFTVNAHNAGSRGQVEIKLKDLFLNMFQSDIAGQTDYQGRGFVLCHNHPQGSNRASTKDDQSTLVVAYIGKCLGMEMIDHWIFHQQPGHGINFFSYSMNRPALLKPSAMLFPEGEASAAAQVLASHGKGFGRG